MQMIASRVPRALLGSIAIYLVWRAIASPSGASGAAPLTRVLLAFLAAALLMLALVPVRHTSAHAADDGDEGRTTASPVATRRQWRSHATQSRAMPRPVSRASGRTTFPRATPPAGVARRPRAHPERVVVLCDGTREGDAACELAQSLAERNGASIRALALFPMTALNRCPAGPADTPGPVECFLSDVNSQLSRTTSNPYLWRLTLVVHDLVGELRRTCTEFHPDTIILPATMCATETGVMPAVSAAVSAAGGTPCATAPILCVAGGNAAPMTRLMPASPRADTRTLAIPATDSDMRRLT